MAITTMSLTLGPKKDTDQEHGQISLWRNKKYWYIQFQAHWKNRQHDATLIMDDDEVEAFWSLLRKLVPA